ncbi:MAG: hypothetical protein GY861_01745, partial [bacterium]|nr:hypothetical protein [bacterium]
SGDLLAFKIFPKIDSISTQTVSLYGGTKICFKGAGFIQNSIGKVVELWIDDDTNPCKVTQVKNEEVCCTTSAITTALKAKFDNSSYEFIGCPGLRYRKFKTSSNDDCATTSSGVAATLDSTKLLKESVMLEGSGPLFQGDNYLEHLDGYFIAHDAGDYRFYISGDDKVTLYLVINGARTKIAENYWSPSYDYTYNPAQISNWITLAKGKYFI